MKNIAIIIAMIVGLLSLNGCWSRRELNDMAIATAIGLDKSGDLIRVSVQVVNPNEVASMAGGGYQTPVTVYTATDRTVLEAIRKLTTIAPRKIYLSQLRVIVIGEAMARSGIDKALDFMDRDREVREEDLYPLVVKQGKAEDVVKILTHLDKIPAMKMLGSLRTQERYWAPTAVIKLSEVLYNLVTHEKEVVMTGIMIEGEKGDGGTKKNVESVQSNSYIKFSDTAVFHDEKLVGWLNETESKGYNFIKNHVTKTAEHFSCPNGDGLVAVEVIRSKTKMKGRITDGRPSIDIAIRAEVNIGDMDCQMDLSDPTSIDLLQQEASKKLNAVLDQSLDKVQHQLKVDIFGFGPALHRANPKAWKKMKNDWDEIFPHVPVNIRTAIFIRNMGTMTNFLPHELKE